MGEESSIKEIKTVKAPLCTLFYEHSEWDTGFGVCCADTLKRIVPENGVSLFEISATYAKQVPPNRYYILGTSEKHAKGRLLDAAGDWMKITAIRRLQGKEAENILEEVCKIMW